MIRSLGLQNEKSKKFLPHPGTLLIGSDGIIRAKLFKVGYKARHGNAAIMAAFEAHANQLKKSTDDKVLHPSGR